MNLIINDLEDVIPYLKQWGERNFRNLPSRRLAICSNLQEIILCKNKNSFGMDKIIRDFLEVCKFWPNHSGYHYYPVPDPLLDLTSQQVYHQTAISATGYWTGDYGELRMNLCRFISMRYDKILNR